MLLMSVRVSPWSDLETRSSSGRLTSIEPSSARATVMGAGTLCVNVPLGPFSRHGAAGAATPAPRRNGDRESTDARHSAFLPSPHEGDDFAADALVVGFFVGQQALARRDDRDAHPAQYFRQLVRLRVHAKARLRD